MPVERSRVWLGYTVPCFRSIAHVITHDPGTYYQTHFGCVAYDYGRGPLAYDKQNDYSDEYPLYQCCNKEIRQLELTKSRHALLKVLLLKSPDNFEKFAATLTCGEHRDDNDRMPVAWTRFKWFQEMSCTNRDWLGSCDCCNTRKPQYRWDAGMNEKDRNLALRLTTHMPPPPEQANDRQDNSSGRAETSIRDTVTAKQGKDDKAAQSPHKISQGTKVFRDKLFGVGDVGSRRFTLAAMAMFAWLLLLALAIVK